MAKDVRGWLRGARGLELFAALVVAALLAMVLLKGASGSRVDRTELEARVERVLSEIEGAGKVSAMITQDEDGACTGALIVAEGLEDVRTYLRLQKAVATLLELEPERIGIIGRSGGFGGGL